MFRKIRKSDDLKMRFRIKNGQALSCLDGQFILVKDKIPARGYKIRNGLEQNPDVSEVDAVLVEKAKSFGLIPIGITNMTQLGLSGIGYNSSKYHGACKNPLNPKFYTSGSSNETAAGIASGLAPYGFGTDGGGSIRKLSFLLRHFWIETDTWTILSSQFF